MIIKEQKSPTKTPKEPIWARGPRYGQHCAIAFMFIHTQHASEIAGNSVALLVEIQRERERECPAPLRRSARVQLAFRLRSARVPSALRLL